MNPKHQSSSQKQKRIIMRKILLLFSLAGIIVFFNNCFTPKAVNSVKAPAKITQYPREPLPFGYKSYALKIVNKTNDLKSPNAFEKTKYLQLNGFEKTAQDSADIIVVFKMLNTHQNVDIESKKITKEDEDGDEHTYKRYYYQLKKKLKADLYIKNKEGEIIEDPNHLGHNDAIWVRYNGSDFNAKYKAKNQWKEDKDKAISKINDKIMEKVLQKTKNQLVKHYSYTKREQKYPVYSFESEDYDYSDLQEAAEVYKKAVKTHSEKGLTKDVKKQLNKSIDIWKKAAKEYRTKGEKSRLSDKSIGYVYFNIALANLWKNDFEKAKNYIERAKSEKRNAMFERSLSDVIDKFAKNHKQFENYKKELKAKRKAQVKKIKKEIKGNWQAYKIDLGRKVDLNGDNVKSANAYHEFDQSNKPIKLFMQEDFKGAMKMGSYELEDTAQFKWNIERDTLNFKNHLSYDKKQKYNIIDEEVIYIHMDGGAFIYNKWPIAEFKDEKLIFIMPLKQGIAKVYMKPI